VYESLHVEAIEDERRVGDRLLDRLDVRAGHVDRDRLDLRRTLGSEGFKEGFEGIGALPRGSPDHEAAIVVDDRRDVLVVLPVADLVDADATQVAERVGHVLALPTNEARDNVADGAPRDAHERGDGGVVGFLRVVGHEFSGGRGGFGVDWSSACGLGGFWLVLQPQGSALTRCALLHAPKTRSKAILHPLSLENAPFDRPLNGQESRKCAVQMIAVGVFDMLPCMSLPE
jgi:hypothetical protein